MNVKAYSDHSMPARNAIAVMVAMAATKRTAAYRREILLNEALEQSFPASDPVSSLRFD